MCTSGKAQPKGCCPSLQCSSPREVCRKLQENVPCIHTDWRQKKSKGVEIKLQEDGKKLQGSSLLLSARVPWEEGSSYWSGTARQAQCDCQDQQQHKKWFIWAFLSVLSESHWALRKQVQLLMVWNWYFDISIFLMSECWLACFSVL